MAYEKWLEGHTALVRLDLVQKHAAMEKDPFSFFRASFYRWCQVQADVCADYSQAPAVATIGDLHVENFGTWRDVEGRLIWGINDFDEAHTAPYTYDLIRLAASAALAGRCNGLAVRPKEACQAILTGYIESLRWGGLPFVLAERHAWLREIATSKGRDHVSFWKKMERLPRVEETVPDTVRQALEYLMPQEGLAYSIRRRVSGLGSLGRARFVALADWEGGRIAREAKALVPSADVWTQQRQKPLNSYQATSSGAVRCKDPYVRVCGNWIVRRLSPYCSRIELASLPAKRDERRLLHAMGWEAANVHLGSRRMVKALIADVTGRKSNWLHKASKAMIDVILHDWDRWQKRNPREKRSLGS